MLIEISNETTEVHFMRSVQPWTKHRNDKQNNKTRQNNVTAERLTLYIPL